MLTSTDQAGHVTRNSYDNLERLIQSTTAFGTSDAATVKYSYDVASQQTSMTDPLGRITTYAYDRVGRQLSATDALLHTTSYGYDAAGQQTSMTNANSATTRYAYDLLGRLSSTTYPDSTSMTTQYDPVGRVLQKTDQGGKATSYTYDPAGRLNTVSNPLHQVTTYLYDLRGDLVSVSDANTHTTLYGYDLAGRKTQKTLPDGTVEKWTYDAAGNAISDQLPDGHTNTTTYDVLNRMSGQQFFDGSSLGYSYTANGLRQQVTDLRGVVTYHYDNQDRLTQIAQSGGNLGYSYDLDGNRTAMNTPARNTVYGYDAANRLTSVGDGAGTLASYTYDPVGNTLSRALGNGITTNYTYDSLNRLTKLSQQQGVTTVASYQYTLDPVGNRTSVTEANGVVTNWTYDAAYRLLSEARCTGACPATSTPTAPTATAPAATPTTAGSAPTFMPGGTTTPAGGVTPTVAPTSTSTSTPTGTTTPATTTPGGTTTPAVTGTPGGTGTPIGSGTPGGATNPGIMAWQASYTYDATGNRLTQTTNNVTTTYSYNPLDELTQATSSAQTAQYTYDGRGNQIFSSVQPTGQGSTTSTFSYDARNELTQQTIVGASTNASVLYAYDADGRRIQRVANGQVTNYLWDEASANGDVAVETDVSHTPQARYILGNGQLVAQERNGATSFYLQDGQQNVRALTDSSGNQTDSYLYDAYGNLQNHTGTTVNPYQYTGQQFDNLTGLYYLRARNYDPTDGRFFTQDSAALDTQNPLELNRYVYTADNPVTSFDPSGHEGFALALTLNSVSIRDTAILAVLGFAVACAYTLTATSLATILGPALDYLDGVPSECQANQMRIQLQLGFTQTNALVAVNIATIGVTTAQIRILLAAIYDISATLAWFKNKSADKQLRDAVVQMSILLKKYPPFGVSEAGNIERVEFPPYRLDLENLRGNNLRE